MKNFIQQGRENEMSKYGIEISTLISEIAQLLEVHSQNRACSHSHAK